MEIIKRRVKRGLIFMNEDRTYHSKPFSSYEERDAAIEKYVEEERIRLKQAEERRRQEYILVHQ